MFRKVFVNGPNLSPEDTVDGDTQCRSLAVHGPAPADHDIRTPHKVQSIDNVFGDDDPALRYLLRPLAPDTDLLGFVSRKQDHPNVIHPTEAINYGVEQNFAFGVVIMGFRRRGSDRDYQLLPIKAEFPKDRVIGQKARDIDIFLDPRVLEDSSAVELEVLIRDDLGMDHPGRLYQ